MWCNLLQIQTTISLEWLIGTAITVLVVVIGAWLNMRVNMVLITAKLVEIEKDIVSDRRAVEVLKVETKEAVHSALEASQGFFDKISIKLDKILDNQSDFKVELEKKENRK